MRRLTLACTEVQVLFYEPEGLLLSAGLLPVDAAHGGYMLLFQLSYLGSGDISVHVAFQQCTGTAGDAPAFATVDLMGATRHRLPSIWARSVAVQDERIDCRLIIWGEPGCDDLLRGELVAEVSGRLPVLAASSRASVTQVEMCTSTLDLASLNAAES